MRSEREILETVLDAARRDDTVRAVIRTDLLPVRDYLYAWNFCFVVNDIARFDGDVFRSCFGERILLFRADRNYPEMFPGVKAHLMVFRDGVTLVIHAMDAAAFLARFDRKSPAENVWIGDTYQKLLDKDHLLPEIERMEEKQTIFAGTPAAEEFDGIHREFWWVMKTFAEYTLRDELPASMFYLNNAVRDLLNRMIRWYVFLKAGHPVDLGILDSRMGEVLDADLFRLYRKTYPGPEESQIRDAFEAVAELWGKTGRYVAARCGYEYPEETETKMTAFIRGLRAQKKA
ncbi:MAG: aminoglycoside 6-adenylyltransferase [Clostridia bacterium]|nr:aminoglycoside 6-adenylyltransferase [Clostridia bacterium]